MTDPQLAIAQALVTWMTPQLSGLGLVEHRIDLSQAAHPRYPANAVTDCPRLLLRPYKGDIAALVNQGVHWAYAWSYWYYRRLATTEQLLADMASIEAPLLANFNPPEISAAGSEMIRPIQLVCHDELSHPLGERRLRVSVGELLIGAVARKH